MFELADRLVGIYKVNNCTQSVTINPGIYCKPPYHNGPPIPPPIDPSVTAASSSDSMDPSTTVNGINGVNLTPQTQVFIFIFITCHIIFSNLTLLIDLYSFYLCFSYSCSCDTMILQFMQKWYYIAFRMRV